MYCGLRMAEIAGLRFESLDFQNNSIYVDKTLQYDKIKNNFFWIRRKLGKVVWYMLLKI